MGDPRQAVIEARFLRGLRLATLGIAVVVLYGLRVPLLIREAGVQQPLAAAVTALGILVLFTLWAAVLVLRDRPVVDVVPPLLVLLAASVLAGTALPGPAFATAAHWSYSAIGWFGVLLLLERPLRALCAFLAVHTAFGALQMVLAGGTDRRTLVSAAAFVILICGQQLCVGFTASALRGIATTAAGTIARRERLATDEAVAEGLHRDRRERYRQVAGTAAPLLAGIASGALQPNDPEVRRACAMESARMRRLFAEADDVEDRLLHELRACIDVAERHGVRAELAVRGSVPELTPATRRALAEPAIAVLGAAATTARVTVVGTPAGVSVSVVVDGPHAPVPGASLRDVAVSVLSAHDVHWVEATWAPGSPTA